MLLSILPSEKLRLSRISAAFLAAFALNAPALAKEALAEEALTKETAELEAEVSGHQETDPKADVSPQTRQPPRIKPVFDDNWVTIGIGVGLVPSYSGSDDYNVFPLPLIVGRVGGVGLRPNGPGLALDLLSPGPAIGSGRDVEFNFGPAFRIRNDRAAQVRDDVVEQLEDLDLAVEVGLTGGVSIPGVLHKRDSVSFNTQIRWDVAGAHGGMLVEPSVGYLTPVSRSALLNVSLGLQFVDDDFAEYYYNVSPADSALSGLPVFGADGGLNSASATAIFTRDLDGNALNGGFSIYTIAGYSRLVGDGADTPFTNIRGDADQFIGGVGVAYTF